MMMNSSKKIGASLAFCVLDIAEGRVSPENVWFIIPGTTFNGPEAAIKEYADTYWQGSLEKCANICKKLWADGKIIQPRLADVENQIFCDRLWYTDAEEFREVQRRRGRVKVVEQLDMLECLTA